MNVGATDLVGFLPTKLRPTCTCNRVCAHEAMHEACDEGRKAAVSYKQNSLNNELLACVKNGHSRHSSCQRVGTYSDIHIRRALSLLTVTKPLLGIPITNILLGWAC
jgi:hypothetical protein